MFLNLGCGSHQPDGWYNVDIWSQCEPNMVADAVTLALPAGSVDRAYMGHLLSYIPFPHVSETVYNVWRMLAPGEYVCAVDVDLDKVNRLGDPLLWEMLQTERYGGRSDHHALPEWECTERKLLEAMREHFPSAQPVDLGRVVPDFPLATPVHWQCAVMARKPAW